MDGKSKLTFGYDVLADLENLNGNFSGRFWQMDLMDEQLHIFRNWFGICVAILGYFAEYFQDDFRILIMADSEIEKIVIIAM